MCTQDVAGVFSSVIQRVMTNHANLARTCQKARQEYSCLHESISVFSPYFFFHPTHQEHPSPENLAQHCELVRALFSMADHYLLFARSTLLSSPALPSLISWAVAGVGMREKEPVTQVLGFLGHLLALPDKLKGGSGGSGEGEEAELALQTARWARNLATNKAEGSARLLHPMVSVRRATKSAQLAQSRGLPGLFLYWMGPRRWT